MHNEDYLPKLHEEIMVILDQVVAICNRYHLKYYLIGGTLLGAVRHQGFIPWDDDLDIVMPRADFDLFINEYAKELPSPYTVKWINTDPNYFQVFAKVCNEKTLFAEMLGDEKLTNTGIFIDIFPLDEVKGRNNEVKRRKWLMSRIKIIMCSKAANSYNHVGQKFLANLLSIKRLHKMATRLMTKSNGKGYQYYANFGSQYSIDKQTHLITSFGDGLLLDFEDKKYSVPVAYDTVLKSIFGNHYMDIPPEEKRRTHYPAKVVFSDGTSLEFDAPIKKLSVNEQ